MPFLSVSIPSYNRVDKLKRCLESIDVADPADIDIIICEDKAPRRVEVSMMVRAFMDRSKYKVRYYENETNLGYDRNLGRLISLSSSDYILLMSDDDSFIPGALDVAISDLKEKMPGIAYSAFIITETGEKKRNYTDLTTIPKGEDSIKKHHDDAILFSGLIYSLEQVKSIDAEEFLNCNYFQVYIFMVAMLNSDGLYISTPLIRCIGDGENGYGYAESAIKNPELMNRKSVFSNMEFNKGLIKVIKTFDERNCTSVTDAFAKDYSMKAFYPMARAKDIGNECLDEYWKRMSELGIKKYPILSVYYWMLRILGSSFSRALMLLPRKVMIYIRSR